MRASRPVHAGAVAVLGLLAALVPVSAAVCPPKMNYEMAKLPNGLTVVLLEDHSTPIVHAQIWYHVGSKDERPGRTGFAHLFEHLMFKGSKNVQPEAHLSMISGVGGQANAYTTEDVTVFWETVPAQYLPLILWLEADRMASLRIDKGTFERERQVVKEERRMRVDNQPYGSLSVLVGNSAAFLDQLKRVGFNRVEVVRLSDLDLTADDFKRKDPADTLSAKPVRRP